MIAITASYALGMLLFNIAFLVDWFRFRRHVRPALRYGLLLAAVAVLLNLGVLALLPRHPPLLVIVSLISSGFLALRIIGFTQLGLAYCATIGHPGFSLLWRGRTEPAPTTAPPPLRGLPPVDTADTSGPTDTGASPPASAPAPTNAWAAAAPTSLDGAAPRDTAALPASVWRDQPAWRAATAAAPRRQRGR